MKLSSFISFPIERVSEDVALSTHEHGNCIEWKECSFGTRKSGLEPESVSFRPTNLEKSKTSLLHLLKCIKNNLYF